MDAVSPELALVDDALAATTRAALPSQRDVFRALERLREDEPLGRPAVSTRLVDLVLVVAATAAAVLGMVVVAYSGGGSPAKTQPQDSAPGPAAGEHKHHHH